jgi:dynein light intermediate chain
MQYVSHDRPERQDVDNLQAALDHALTDQQARLQGICPIRESLFAQVFDEIIRQVTINCPERGLMLLRLRDERKMTMAAYETAYQEGLAYGTRKQLEAEEGLEDMEGQVKALEFRKGELERGKVELLSKQGSMQQKIRERKAAVSERKQYELQCLARQNDSLRRFVEMRREAEKPPEEPEEEEET